MSKETLSPKQAQEIINKIEEIIGNCTTRIEQRNNEFITRLSMIWEDQKAVDFATAHKNNMENLFTTLRKNTLTFEQKVKEISVAYGLVGGLKLELNMDQNLRKEIQIDIGKVKPNFSNEDEFGFKNIDTGPTEVQEAFNELERDLGRYINDAISEINNINAFGNDDIRINLSQSAGRIVETLKENIHLSKNKIDDNIKETVTEYKKVGQAATTTASISTK